LIPSLRVDQRTLAAELQAKAAAVSGILDGAKLLEQEKQLRQVTAATARTPPQYARATACTPPQHARRHSTHAVTARTPPDSAPPPLDLTRMRSPPNLMTCQAEEEKRRAEIAAAQVMMRGPDGGEVSMREGLESVFKSELVLSHVAQHIHGASSARSFRVADGKYANDVNTLMLGAPEKSSVRP
jgi:hypothetical protein